MKSNWVRFHIGFGHVSEMLLKDGAGVEHFFFGKVDEDIARRVRRANIKAANTPILKLEITTMYFGR